MSYVFLSNRKLFAGSPRRKGDPVPDGLSSRKIKLLLNARIIGPDSQPQRQLPTDPPPEVEPPQSAPAQTDATPAPAQTDATPAKLVNTGAGWYNIEVEGLGAVNESKIRGEDDARAWAAENGYSLSE